MIRDILVNYFKETPYLDKKERSGYKELKKQNFQNKCIWNTLQSTLQKHIGGTSRYLKKRIYKHYRAIKMADNPHDFINYKNKNKKHSFNLEKKLHNHFSTKQIKTSMRRVCTNFTISN